MIDFTQSPEIMEALRKALAVAAASLDLGGGGTAQSPDAENTWLTTDEAMAYLRTPPTTFKRARKDNPEFFVVSYALGSSAPRFQLAALQRFMRNPEKLTGQLPLELPPMPAKALNGAANGKDRGVSVGAPARG